MKKNLNTKEFIEILYMIAENIEKNKDYFSELDRATGDGDHGVTMSIGWNAIKEKLSNISPHFIIKIYNTISLSSYQQYERRR